MVLGEHMKTSIFDMNFTLPPLVLMTEVVKELPTHTKGSDASIFCTCGFC